jgi:hypothetical protein
MPDLAAVDRGPLTQREDLEPGDDYFPAPGPGYGPHALALRFGPLRLRLAGLSEAQIEALAGRYRPFLSSDEDADGAAIEVRVGPAGVERFLRDPDPGASEVYRLGSRTAGERLVLWSYEFAGWLEARRRAAAVVLVAPEGPLFERGLENFLRIVTASFLLEQGGFLLHASAVVRDGKAYVFFGPSGSGKTTVTRLSPEDIVLSDDLTMVVRRDDGGLAAAGIPFGLAHHRPPQHAGAFPIVSFNRLVQARKVRREPIGGARAVAEVLASLPFVLQDTRQGDEAVRVVGRALQAAPVHRLEFREEPSFWAVVQEGA